MTLENFKLKVRSADHVRILIVDDDPILTTLLSSLCHAKGFEVRAYSNMKDAYREALERDFDVAILDYDLGRVTGVQFSRYLEHYGKHYPKLIMSHSESLSMQNAPNSVKGSVSKGIGYSQVVADAIELLKV